MKKFLTVSSCIALLANSALAEGFFVSGNLGFIGLTSLATKRDYPRHIIDDIFGSSGYLYEEAGSDTSTSRLWSFSGGLNAGYIINKNNRVYLGINGLTGPFTFSSAENAVTQIDSSLTREFILGYDLVTNTGGIFGIYTGYADTTINYSFTSEHKFIYDPTPQKAFTRNYSGIVYGVKIGFGDNLTESSGISMGIKIENISYFNGGGSNLNGVLFLEYTVKLPPFLF